MTGSVAIDVFIGLAFIFLLYSLLATVVIEFISTSIGLRARNLEWTIERMLSDQKEYGVKFIDAYLFIQNSIIRLFYRKKKGLLKQFYDIPEIKYLSEGGLFNKPSYIKPETFSRATIEALKKISTANKKDDRGKIDDALENATVENLNGDTKEQLQIFWQEASKDIVKFRSLIEEWFDSMNDRATGWYKRKVQLLLLVVGLFIALWANLDAIKIANKLAVDDDARERLVAIAIKKAEISDDSTKKYKAYKVLEDSLKQDLSKANQILGLGWPKGTSTQCKICTAWNANYGLGYLVTAFAISLGSPFWFDLLNKLVKLRSSVAQPTSSQQGSGTGGGRSRSGSTGTGNDVIPARRRKG